MTRRYSKNGIGHRVLTKLAAGPVYCEELQALGLPIKELSRVLIALSGDGMIELTRRGYEITPEGTAELATLEAYAATPKTTDYGMRAQG